MWSAEFECHECIWCSSGLHHLFARQVFWQRLRSNNEKHHIIACHIFSFSYSCTEFSPWNWLWKHSVYGHSVRVIIVLVKRKCANAHVRIKTCCWYRKSISVSIRQLNIDTTLETTHFAATAEEIFFRNNWNFAPFRSPEEHTFAGTRIFIVSMTTTRNTLC